MAIQMENQMETTAFVKIAERELFDGVRESYVSNPCNKNHTDQLLERTYTSKGILEMRLSIHQHVVNEKIELTDGKSYFSCRRKFRAARHKDALREAAAFGSAIMHLYGFE